MNSALIVRTQQAEWEMSRSIGQGRFHNPPNMFTIQIHFSLRLFFTFVDSHWSRNEFYFVNTV